MNRARRLVEPTLPSQFSHLAGGAELASHLPPWTKAASTDSLSVLTARLPKVWAAGRRTYGCRVLVLTEIRSARAEAARLLGTASDRWKHVVGVAAAARAISSTVHPGEAGLLVAAAWLHDVGYSPEIAYTGFHPLDGARYLRGMGAPMRLCALVAHHSAAAVEAGVRGLAGALEAEFTADRSVVADALTYCDMTTGPTGATVTVEDRLVEVVHRYPEGHPVHEAMSIASPQIIATVASIEVRLAYGQPR